MGELLSVGLDVGTTSTQMIVSRLLVENRASSFSVPRMEITSREILYESPVHFTPLLGTDRVDGEALRLLVASEYDKAGITPADVDTGAVIITGETSRRENAQTVVKQLSHIAGNFVVATAGPDLESVLAAKGSGATDYSAKTGKTVLHFDIGGGTANIALIQQGRICQTGCLNVGGRLIRVEGNRISYVSPVLHGLTDLQVGDMASAERLQPVCRLLTGVLEMAAGLTPPTDILQKLITNHIPDPPKDMVISFSGGVADSMEKDFDIFAFGDIGVLLGRTIRNSLLCRGAYRLGDRTIRATVIGAGCHSTQLSGSTVFCKGVDLPLYDLPVAVFSEEEQELSPGELSERIRKRCEVFENPPILFFPGVRTYGEVRRLAEAISLSGLAPVLAATRRDMAKALGQSLALLLPGNTPVLCLDGIALEEGDYLDVGKKVELAFPVVVKTLIFSK